jgi:multidrug efflux pump
MSEYLDRIRFRAEDFNRTISGYVGNMRLVALLILGLVLGGSVSYFTLPRTLTPEIGITIVTVTTTLPGASPSDIEELVTNPIEDEIKSLDDIDTLSSSSRESVSSIVVWFDDSVERQDALDEVRNAVDEAGDLPEDASEPTVSAIDFDDDPIVQYAVTSAGDGASLDRFALRLRDRLEDESDIDRVELSGEETREVSIMFDPERLTVLNLDLRQVSGALAASLGSYPSGLLQADGLSFGLSIDRQSLSVDDLRQVVIHAGETHFRLGEFADITEREEPGGAPAFLSVPGVGTEQAITLAVHRASGASITEVGSVADQVVSEVKVEAASGGIRVAKVSDVSEDIREQFASLFRNLGMTVGLVFVVLFLFVGLRQAGVAALSIPMTFMAAFAAMRIFDISLNFLSLFSLLLSLGLLVDVTIVIVSAMTSYFRTGKFSAHETGLLVLRDFFMTLIVTTLTTVWAFVPLLLAGGIIGEYIKPIPVIVSTVLLSSVLIGFLVILPLMVWLLDFFVARRVKVFFALLLLLALGFASFRILALAFPGLPVAVSVLIVPIALLALTAFFLSVRKFGARVLSRLCRKFVRTDRCLRDTFHDGILRVRSLEILYRGALARILSSSSARRRTIAAVVVFFLFSVSLLPAGLVKSEFFPGEDTDILYVTAELASGTTADESGVAARDLLDILLDVPEIALIQTQVGRSAFGSAGDHTVLFTLRLTPVDERRVTSPEIAEYIRSLDAVRNFASGDISVTEIGGGPPAGAAVVITFSGGDLDELDAIANRAVSYLSDQEGVVNARKSVEVGTAKVVFIPDTDLLSEYGLSVAEIGSTLRAYGSGLTVSDDVVFDDLDEKRDVVVRVSPERLRADTLERIRIATPGHGYVPLSSLGRFELSDNPTIIEHEEGERTLTVEADVLEGYNAQEINAALAVFADDGLDLPRGYSWDTGGQNEENEKSVVSIIQAMILAFILIFLTLIIRLNSYRKSLLVLLVIPLAISGVFVFFGLFGLPLSFPALIGILALFGIVINNSIIIVDQINRNRELGLSFQDAVTDGATSRLEPILLSSLTTVIGLSPITFSEPVWLGLGGAIISGLVFSGTIMLFFIPVIYYSWFRGEEEETDSAL